MKPIVLCILDGVGMRDDPYGNAFKAAKTPHFDLLWQEYPHIYLKASGEAVGLPKGQMGNSEVGHLNIGAGRIVYQPLQLITKAIHDQSFFQNEAILDVIHHVHKKHSTLHIMGLLSDGGIHSHIDHLFALLDLCKKENVEKLYLHLFTDGRDTAPMVALTYFDQLNKKLEELKIGKIATISGRFYAMDRDNRWDRIEKAYCAICFSKGENYSNYKEAIQSNYDRNISDEFIVPAVLDPNGKVQENDGILIFNYRPDRLRELFSSLSNPKFEAFERPFIKNIKMASMMPVSEEVISKPAFHHQILDNLLGDIIDKHHIKQLRIAETEKYAHVTSFLDGGIDKKYTYCDRILIPSPHVTTYDLSPKMSALEITDQLLDKLEEDYEFVVVNYANGDMLGHTGILKAAVESLETVDICLGRLYDEVKKKQGILIITADHGNCEYMIDEDGNPDKKHTTSLVPFIICDPKYTFIKKVGKLGDIAPTILKMMDLEIPEDMTGDVLIK